MEETTNTPDVSEAVLGPKKPYARPEIAWEEEYKPTAFGVSCARVPGEPQCNPGPLMA